MRARTVLTILLVFASVWFAVSTIRLNEALVTIQFAFFQPIELELWMVMLAAFGVGAGVILFFDLAGGARTHTRRGRRRFSASAGSRCGSDGGVMKLSKICPPSPRLRRARVARLD